MIDFKRIQDEFAKYVKMFDLNNPKIILKYYHTIEVANISYEIAKRLGLSNELCDLAKLIGFLHDIGRFDQVTQTKSFKDVNMDHADHGVEILFDRGMIRNFIDDDTYDEIIRKSIQNHNKFAISDSMNEQELMFSNIIRDADKIDIFRVRVETYTNEALELPSQKVVNSFREHKCIHHEDIKNKTDSLICVIAFIYDFNYDVSVCILSEKGYYQKFLDSIKINDAVKSVFVPLKEEGIIEQNRRI